MSKTGPHRILIAVGACGTSIVLATDSSALAFDMDTLRDGAEDLGIICDGDKPPGLYLFEGEGAWHHYTDFEGGTDADLEWSGELRTVVPAELAELLAMRPPEPEMEGGS